MATSSLAGDGVVHRNARTFEEMINERLQIVNDEKKFNQGLAQQIEQWGLQHVGFDYNIVAVFGSQSTGKSTLLNALFGTDFDVMDGSKRQQTTKGIWMCRGKGTNIVVMDLEGADGRERGEDKDFERKSAVFALASSEVLIINMWEYQIGWHDGANMGLLKTVFEVNLNLFGKMGSYGRTLLLFVIRDHYDGTPLASLRATLISDLSRIWDELSKPAELENRLLSDYFDLEFTTLPHKMFVPEKFDAEVQALRNHFVNKGSLSYLFKDAYCKRVPADGIALYMEGIWEQVQSAKDLDLPTQQELLAHVRCNEISTTVLAMFKRQIKVHKRLIKDGRVIEKLGDMMNNWKTQAMSQFDCDASRYHKAVYEQKRTELLTKLTSALSPLFFGQLQNLRRLCLFKFEIELGNRLRGTKSYVFHFGGVISEERLKWEGNFEKRTREALVEDTDWVWQNELDLLRKDVEGAIGRCKKKGRERLLTQLIFLLPLLVMIYLSKHHIRSRLLSRNEPSPLQQDI